MKVSLVLAGGDPIPEDLSDTGSKPGAERLTWVILSGILGGIIDSLGGANLGGTCCVLRMPIAESMTTARVSDPMVLSQAFPPQACLGR